LSGIINTDGKINLGIPTRVDEDGEIVLPPDKRTSNRAIELCIRKGEFPNPQISTMDRRILVS
jgi:hypothetical protein